MGNRWRRMTTGHRRSERIIIAVEGGVRLGAFRFLPTVSWSTLDLRDRKWENDWLTMIIKKGEMIAAGV